MIWRGEKENSIYKEPSKQQQDINQQQKQQLLTSTHILSLFLSLFIHILYIAIMKFSIGMLVAFVATSQLAASAPVPDWNGKNAEAV